MWNNWVLTSEVELYIYLTLCWNPKTYLIFLTIISDVLILFFLVSELYDAYIAYAKDDQGFVDEIVAMLEGPPYCMKVCTDCRELSDAAAKAIETHCSKVLVVLSESFNRCPDADYMVNFALHLSRGLFSHGCFIFMINYICSIRLACSYF